MPKTMMILNTANSFGEASRLLTPVLPRPDLMHQSQILSSDSNDF
jgi:hypothetical protein